MSNSPAATCPECRFKIRGKNHAKGSHHNSPGGRTSARDRQRAKRAAIADSARRYREWTARGWEGAP